MKKHYSLIIALTFAGFAGLSSCKQNDTPPPPTKTELMTRMPWFFLSASAGGTDVSNTPQLTCFKDNTNTFATTGQFTINEGVNVCSPSTAGNFTWSFMTSETELNLSAPLFPGGSGTFTIVSLTTDNLVLSQNVTIPPSPTPVLVTFTFKH
ncbi:MAG: hypothetical protein IPP93_15545 [Chitinophagaceae bacterium]|nr:hypothetical protein [Chitinophagaceae bacterium]MBL0335419.1 hypothetical protein [Chitinophagaceae bacterium]